MPPDHNSLLHISQLSLLTDKGDQEYVPFTDNYWSAVNALVKDSLRKKVDLDSKMGLIVRVDPAGRWNPKNALSKEMGLNWNLAKNGFGTGLVYFSTLNSGDMIPDKIVADPNTADLSHKGWSRSAYVFTAKIDELSSIQVPQIALFSDSPDRLVFVKKLNKNIPSVWLGNDPCKKKKTAANIPKAKKTGSFKEKDGLVPKFKQKVEAVMKDLKKKGWQPEVVSGRRTWDQQKAMVHANQSPMMNSAHLHGYAAKIVDVRYRDKKVGSSINKHKFWDALGTAAQKHGLIWGGTWRKGFVRPKVKGDLFDGSHLHWPGYMRDPDVAKRWKHLKESNSNDYTLIKAYLAQRKIKK